MAIKFLGSPALPFAVLSHPLEVTSILTFLRESQLQLWQSGRPMRHCAMECMFTSAQQRTMGTQQTSEILLAVHGVFDFVVQSLLYTWQAAIDDELHHNCGPTTFGWIT